MSINQNDVRLQGRISKDPKIESTQAGTCKATFNIATTRYWKDQSSGARNEKTVFSRCVTYGTNAELIANYAGKGKEVLVSGYLDTYQYGTQQDPKWMTEVNVENVQLGADARTNTDQQPQQPQPAACSNRG